MSRFAPSLALPFLCAALLMPAGIAAAQAPSHQDQHAAAPAANALGDLDPYRAIAEDTLKIVRAGDLSAAKTRIRDLEKSWDDAEDRMKPHNPTEWKAVDKAIDLALAKLRAGSPDQTACTEALQNLIVTIDTVEKKG
jgi:hypothetical protein